MKAPTQRDDQETLAKQIAMDVCARRKAGENISDQQVLREHPQLHDALQEQLGRLRRIESARSQADQATPVPLSDLAQTCELPPPIEEEAPDELRVTFKEQTQDEAFHGTLIVQDTAVEVDGKKSNVPLYRPTVRAPMAVIKLFHDGTTNHTTYPVFADRFRIGRIEGDIVVVHDFWMSGRHAEIQRRRSGDRFQWFLVDMKSTNGTFIQAESVDLKHNDELFLGQERYRFCNQNGRAGLVHATKGVGQQWWFKARRETVGQTVGGLKSFATDPFLDPVHAEFVQRGDGTWIIQDNNSQNGVWYRVAEIELAANSAFQLGEQRFGFWFSTDLPRPLSLSRP